MSARMQDSGDFLHVSSVKKERDACLSTAATLSRHQSWQRTLLAGRLGEPFSQLVSKANLACVYMTVYPVVQATQRSEYGKNTLRQQAHSSSLLLNSTVQLAALPVHRGLHMFGAMLALPEGTSQHMHGQAVVFDPRHVLCCAW